MLVQSLIIFVTDKKKIGLSAVSLFVIFPFILTSLITSKDVVWSPYQKLSITELPANPIFPDGVMLNVNNVGYMGLLNLSEEYSAIFSAMISIVLPSLVLGQRLPLQVTPARLKE